MRSLRKRTQAVLTVGVLTDRYRRGEVVLRPRYSYDDGNDECGAARRMALGDTLEESAAAIWEFIFAWLLEMQEQAPAVALKIEWHNDGDWARTLVIAFALAAAHELSIPVVQSSDAQLPLFSLVT